MERKIEPSRCHLIKVIFLIIMVAAQHIPDKEMLSSQVSGPGNSGQSIDLQEISSWRKNSRFKLTLGKTK